MSKGEVWVCLVVGGLGVLFFMAVFGMMAAGG